MRGGRRRGVEVKVLRRDGRASLGSTCEASPAIAGVVLPGHSAIQALDWPELDSAGRGLPAKHTDREGRSGLSLCHGIEAG